MADYKITAISPEQPREWANPRGGTVYYIKVRVEGHDKPLEVGKKAPDALHVGDVLHGTINYKPEFDSDGFKADAPAFGGGQSSFSGGSFSSSSKPAYQPRDDDAIRAQWAIGQASQVVTALYSEGNRKEAYDFILVEKYAKEFYRLVGSVKGSNGGSEDTSPKAPQTASNPARWDKQTNPWPSDQTDAEFASMVQAGLRADGIEAEEYPI